MAAAVAMYSSSQMSHHYPHSHHHHIAHAPAHHHVTIAAPVAPPQAPRLQHMQPSAVPAELERAMDAEELKVNAARHESLSPIAAVAPAGVKSSESTTAPAAAAASSSSAAASGAVQLSSSSRPGLGAVRPASSVLPSSSSSLSYRPSAPSASLQGMLRYHRKEKLGEGTYGVVYKGVDLLTGAVVALKKVRLEIEDNGIPSSSLRECSILLDLQHPNIVELQRVVLEGEGQSLKLYLVFEFIEFDLAKYMHYSLPELPAAPQPRPAATASSTSAAASTYFTLDDPPRQKLAPLLVKSYMYQLLRGIAFCQSRRILHRDLKPANLLIDRQGTLKIADFGLSRSFSLPIRALTQGVVTLWYRAPEILMSSQQYSTGVDIWSCGCIFAEMLSSRPLLKGDCALDQIIRILALLGTPTEDSWPGVTSMPDYSPSWPKWQRASVNTWMQGVPDFDPQSYDLLSKMLVYDPSKRISAKDALNHPDFDEIRPAAQKQMADALAKKVGRSLYGNTDAASPAAAAAAAPVTAATTSSSVAAPTAPLSTPRTQLSSILAANHNTIDRLTASKAEEDRARLRRSFRTEADLQHQREQEVRTHLPHHARQLVQAALQIHAQVAQQS